MKDKEVRRIGKKIFLDNKYWNLVFGIDICMFLLLVY